MKLDPLAPLVFALAVTPAGLGVRPHRYRSVARAQSGAGDQDGRE